MTGDVAGTATGDVIAQWVDITSKIATSGTLLVALFGGWIALLTYRSSVRNASSALIHSLFKDYLLLRWQYHQIAKTAAEASDSDNESLAEQLAGVKLYVLEEMFWWVLREEASLRRTQFFYRLNKKGLRKKISSLEAWKSTIRTHLKQHQQAVRDSIFDWTTCYSVDFLRFVANDWNEPGLSKLVSDHEQAETMLGQRPLGRKEGNPRGTSPQDQH